MKLLLNPRNSSDIFYYLPSKQELVLTIEDKMIKAYCRFLHYIQFVCLLK